MKKIIFILILFFSFQTSYAGDYKRITVQEAYRIKQTTKEKILFLDVRTPEEFTGMKGHVKGSVLIPVQILDQKLDLIKEYKDKEVLIICNSGNRSRTASVILLRAGFQKIKDIDGGITAWNRAGFPSVR